MKKLLSLFVASVLAAPAVLSAADFEGTVKLKMTGSRENPPEMTFSIKGTASRIDIPSQRGPMAMLTDSTKPEMTILMIEQHAYMTMPSPVARAAESQAATAASEATMEKTAETAKILGYDCTKYISKDKTTVTELWVTDQLGSFGGLNFGSPMGGRGRAAASGGQPWEKALVDMKTFPLRVISKVDGKETFQMEATAVEKKSLDAALFVPPADYQDMSAMMKGMKGLPKN